MADLEHKSPALGARRPACSPLRHTPGCNPQASRVALAPLSINGATRYSPGYSITLGASQDESVAEDSMTDVHSLQIF
jgi:hypothetical protein